MCSTVCITFISYFDKIKSCAKKEPESSGNEISTSRPTGLSNSPVCRSALKKTTKGSRESVCDREIKSDKKKNNSCVCFWKYICAIVCVRMENDHFKQRFAQRGETQSWLSYRLSQYENQWAAGKRLPCEYFFIQLRKKKCSTFTTYFNQGWDWWWPSLHHFLITAIIT